MNDNTDIRKALFEMCDEKYKAFQSKLIPNIKSENMIGIRIPNLRKFAKSIAKTPQANEFLRDLPHKFYEENNLHAFLICEIVDYRLCIDELDKFLPFIDNWSTCDSLSPKVFIKNKDLLIKDIDRWLASNHEYTVRFGIEMLMKHFLDNDFRTIYAEKVCNANRGDYYISMMTAWYFATALAKNYDEILPFFKERRLDAITHNRAVKKALESFRIDDDKKAYLKTLKV